MSAKHDGRAGDADLTDLRDRLIVASLPHIPFEGWSRRALIDAAHDIGLEEASVDRLFEDPARDAVAHFVHLADRLTISDAGAVDMTEMGDRGRLMAVIRLRFERWAPHREAVKRAIALLALPANMMLGAKLTWGTADAIWKATGRASHDFSWYTRRASVAAVYGATLLAWLDDKSEDLADTVTFLGRRLDDVVNAIKLRRRASSWLEQWIPHPPRTR